MIFSLNMCPQITGLKSLPHLPGANELIPQKELVS